MKYLSAQQVLFLHSCLIVETGGSHGLRDLAGLEAALARPQATFDGQELYPGVFTQAAALLDSLVNNHPFLDGNKRTGIAVAALFLKVNGWQLQASNDEMIAFTLRVVGSKLEIPMAAAWLQRNCRAIEKTP